MIKLNFTIIAALVLLFLLTNVINLKTEQGPFITPDETYNHIIITKYANDSKMYFETPYSKYDLGNNLHPRGFITYKDKIVPFFSLGMPLFYGVFYGVFQNYLSYLPFIILVMIILVLKNIYELFYPKHKINIVLFLSFAILCIPLMYFSNFVYFNILPASLFFLLFLYYTFKFNASGYFKDLMLGIFFSLISIWFRYEYVLFVALFLFLNFLKNKEMYLNQKNKIIKISALAGMCAVVFLAPLLVMNHILYDNPFAYGYSLSNSIFFSGERDSNLMAKVISIFLPSRELSLDVLYANFITILLLISPIFYIGGYLVIMRENLFKKIGAYWIFIIYVMIYLGTSTNTYLSGSMDVTVVKSMVRYWFILNLFMILLFVRFFSNELFNKKMRIFIFSIMLVLSICTLTPELQKNINSLESYTLFLNKVRENIPKDSYLITPIYDKVLFIDYKIIGWWASAADKSTEDNFDPGKMRHLIQGLSDNNETIYAYKSAQFTEQGIKKLEDVGIIFHKTNIADMYKVEINETVS